jgi:hypothetical protein
MPRYSFHVPDPELSELRERLMLLKSAVTLLRLRNELKYSDDQPRWPAGDPRGGQWRPKEGGEGEGYEEGDGEDRGAFFATDSDSLSSFGEAPDGTLIETSGTSGFSSTEEQMTVQQFRSAFCQASIREVLPG